MRTRLLVVTALVTAFAVVTPGVARAQHLPSFDEILSLHSAQSPAISPDGAKVVYQVRQANWEENAWETEIWLVDVGSGAAHQLTNGKGSSSGAAWSPDGRWIAFISDRDDSRQIHLIRPDGGESRALTSVDDGVSRFAWAPDSDRIAYVATDPVTAERKARDERSGEFQIVDEDLRMAHLYVTDAAGSEPRRLTHGSFVVGAVAWSPDGRTIAFDHRVSSDPSQGGTADISLVQADDGTVRVLVSQPGPDQGPVWSPDGTRVAFSTSMASQWFYYTNREIATVPIGGGEPQVRCPERDRSCRASPARMREAGREPTAGAAAGTG